MLKAIKYLLPLLSVFLLCCSNNAKKEERKSECTQGKDSTSVFSLINKKTDWEVDGLKGKVQEVDFHEGKVQEVDGKVQEVNIPWSSGYAMYNIKGKRIKQYKDGVLTSYLYDEEGNCIGSTNTISVCEERGYFYVPTKRVFKLDERGNKIKELRYNGNGILLEWSEYIYDDITNERKDLSYGSGGNLESTCLLKYDTNGNMVESLGITYFNKGDTLIRKNSWNYVRTYNEKGYITHEKEKWGNKWDKSVEYIYDEKGKKKKKNERENDCYKKFVYKHDSIGNIIEETQIRTWDWTKGKDTIVKRHSYKYYE